MSELLPDEHEHVHDFSHRQVSGTIIHTRRQAFGCCACGLSEPMFDHLIGATGGFLPLVRDPQRKGK